MIDWQRREGDGWPGEAVGPDGCGCPHSRPAALPPAAAAPPPLSTGPASETQGERARPGAYSHQDEYAVCGAGQARGTLGWHALRAAES